MKTNVKIVMFSIDEDIEGTNIGIASIAKNDTMPNGVAFQERRELFPESHLLLYEL